ncbi:prepilin peptidase [Candidatus Saccharibacteria bacterium]|nr:prepilin peptidase [Candidatus Saccharibacteria bacterium]
MQIVFLVMMFVMGAAVGSFLCCQVRRLRLKELGKKKLGARSVCMHCKKKLKWWENIPIVSWILLRGKCSKCGRKIGGAEIVAELGTAVAMVIVGTTIDVEAAGWLDWMMFGVMTLLVLDLIFLAIYDGLYGELPVMCLTFAVICGIMVCIGNFCQCLIGGGISAGEVWNVAGAVAILGGVYLILYIVSKGRWVGSGDWVLGTAIGLALGSAWLALVTLFLANLFATLLMWPAMKSRKARKIYFGPFMVAAFLVVLSISDLLKNMI